MTKHICFEYCINQQDYFSNKTFIRSCHINKELPTMAICSIIKSPNMPNNNVTLKNEINLSLFCKKPVWNELAHSQVSYFPDNNFLFDLDAIFDLLFLFSLTQTHTHTRTHTYTHTLSFEHTCSLYIHTHTFLNSHTLFPLSTHIRSLST